MENPYDVKTQATLYHNWQAGYSSESAESCPYEGDDQENQEFRLIWMKGFHAKQKEYKSNTKEKKTVADKSKTTAVNDLTKLSDTALIKELIARKQPELDRLKKQREEIDKKIALIEAICNL